MPDGFRVDVEVNGPTIELHASGDLDPATATVLRSAVDEALSQDVAELVLRMDGVTFMDSSGISCLIQAREAAAARGATLTLSGLRPPVRRVLEITDLLGFLGIDDEPSSQD